MTDAELDVALSELTAAEPDPRLTDRVMRAIGAPPEPRRASGWPALAALGAAAVLVLSIGITWRAWLAGPWSQAATGPAPSVTITSAIEAVPWETASALSDDKRGRASALPSGWGMASALKSGRRAVRTIPEEAPWPYRLPALARSEPLAVDRLAREAIGHQEIGVEPLSIARLEIESLER